MRLCLKCGLILMLVTCLFACGKKQASVSIEKEGQLYEAGEMASFYYPKDYSIDITSQDKSVVKFVKNDEMIFYAMVQDDTDNRLEDMPTLYAGVMEEDGVDDIVDRSIELPSGLTCHEFTGTYKATGIQFKHIVYFTVDATYILGYETVMKTYGENIDMISQYLQTLTVNHK